MSHTRIQILIAVKLRINIDNSGLTCDKCYMVHFPCTGDMNLEAGAEAAVGCCVGITEGERYAAVSHSSLFDRKQQLQDVIKARVSFSLFPSPG